MASNQPNQGAWQGESTDDAPNQGAWQGELDAAGGWPNDINGVASADIGKINEVATADISTVNGA